MDMTKNMSESQARNATRVCAIAVLTMPTELGSRPFGIFVTRPPSAALFCPVDNKNSLHSCLAVSP